MPDPNVVAPEPTAVRVALWRAIGHCVWNILWEVISLLYLGLASVGLILLKGSLYGPVGSWTKYYVVVVFIPLAYLVLGFLRNRFRGLLIHLVVLGSSAYWVWATFPENPELGFERESWPSFGGSFMMMALAGAVVMGVWRGLRPPGSRPSVQTDILHPRGDHAGS